MGRRESDDIDHRSKSRNREDRKSSCDRRKRKRSSENKTKRSRASSSSSSSSSSSHRKVKEKKKKLKSRSSSTSSSSSSSSSSSKEAKKKKKKRKETKKKLKRKKKKNEKKVKKEQKKLEEKDPIPLEKPQPYLQTWQCEDHGPDMTDEQKARLQTRRPLTKEEYEARQSVIRRVLDPETGRTRLVRGDGEILEEIVSKERHKDINKQATKGDGDAFQKRLGNSR
ncbi:ADP-ribosylation factor-like protein 6-interacting protein 4 [Triplophysa rosa]|uniref:ADP-ribosylation factor-like protein 6-interacting protein 4 n=1 Tax=Triplophysa rosa TaxID=992332 RepID=UPI00254607F8|nr:ADP-ribosylation factor-like protein 6-interacting protein 4 [Triplophysa rosa]